MKDIRNETAANYGDLPGDELIAKAQKVIRARLTNSNTPLTRPQDTSNYLQVLIGGCKSEVFSMLTLDNRNRPLKFHELFSGTIDGASVYPREVVKQALEDNAAAVIFAHNHPSGVSEPSQSDIRITDRLKRALETIEVRVLDHIIIGEDITYFSVEGLI